ncbi:helix-turn-helix domain-containing protein [Sphingomonas sp. RB1R13]|uniref:helix-turn-helix domain-containing protein n=1 Tax=Sphingomonas sp. RB1R13 TaxID=3096159 RepID=UPI003FA6D8F6
MLSGARLDCRLDCTPAHHYREMRPNDALALTRCNGMRVHDAALAAGFSSQPVFSRSCKQHFGLSPRGLLQRGPLA